MFTAIALSGGSTKGVSFIGVFQKLEETGIRNNINTISGCSIGTIFGLLLVLNFSLREMKSLLNKVDFNRVVTINLNTLFNDFAFSDFDKIKQVIIQALKWKNLNSDITFQQLYQFSNIHYITNAVCLDTECIEYFDYITNPNMPILLAIQMACAIPLLFPRIVYNNKTYIDGGIIDDLPINCLKAIPKNQILAIRLSDSSNNININTLFGYLIRVINLITKKINNTSTNFDSFNNLNLRLDKDNISDLSQPNNKKLTCCNCNVTINTTSLDCFVLNINIPLNLLNINITKEQIDKFIESAYQQTSYYFALWKIKHNLILPLDSKKFTLSIKLKSNLTN